MLTDHFARSPSTGSMHRHRRRAALPAFLRAETGAASRYDPAAAPIGYGASSAWAQGGIAAAMSRGDTFQKHVADTVAPVPVSSTRR
ncbi:hypothetical protein F2981_11435 [Sinorhizobium meliloti]|nr:hypothetical protein [Sinorhizobium meliloti]